MRCCQADARQWAGMGLAPLRRSMTTNIVVMDDADTRDVLVLVLRDAGYHVLAVPYGQAALRVLGIIRPHLVLTDVAMPVMDGHTLCATVAADPTQQAIPRVLMSIWWQALTDRANVTTVLRTLHDPGAARDGAAGCALAGAWVSAARWAPRGGTWCLRQAWTRP